MNELSLNRCGLRLCEHVAQHAGSLGVNVQLQPCGAILYDFGILSSSTREAGELLTRICLADQADVQTTSSSYSFDRSNYASATSGSLPGISVYSNHPLRACIGAQYAGWPIQVGKYFAMGSGPMRALRGKEKILVEHELQEKGTIAVGVLETRKFPTEDVLLHIAAECGVPPSGLHLCIAPTASLAGRMQIVGRSLETALHKLHEVGLNLNAVRSGYGFSPIPPETDNDMIALGTTNDAMLLGADVIVWLSGVSDDEMFERGRQTPSHTSRDFGKPFGEIFKSYGYDFYKIDPHLFSPSRITLVNQTTGTIKTFGQIHEALMRTSFGI
jgi:methenyltetrahydromethanopterin cyclohydrolase